MPLRRYHTPSRVRQTSSASILPPLVSTMTGFPPWRLPIPGPLVETGSVVARECDAETVVGEGLTDGDGDGEGGTTGDGEGFVTTGCATATGAIDSVSVELLLAYRLTAK